MIEAFGHAPGIRRLTPRAELFALPQETNAAKARRMRALDWRGPTAPQPPTESDGKDPFEPLPKPPDGWLVTGVLFTADDTLTGTAFAVSELSLLPPEEEPRFGEAMNGLAEVVNGLPEVTIPL